MQEDKNIRASRGIHALANLHCGGCRIVVGSRHLSHYRFRCMTTDSMFYQCLCKGVDGEGSGRDKSAQAQ